MNTTKIVRHNQPIDRFEILQNIYTEQGDRELLFSKQAAARGDHQKARYHKKLSDGFYERVKKLDDPEYRLKVLDKFAEKMLAPYIPNIREVLHG